MTLRSKTLLIMGASILAMLLGLYLVTSTILMRSYHELENDSAKRNAQQVQDALLNEIKNLDTKLTDWAAWDDTWNFVSDGNAEYAESNLGAESIFNLHLNFMVFLDAAGGVVSARAVHLDEATLVEPPEGLLEALQPGTVFLNHPHGKHSVTGVWMLPGGPCLLASRPVVQSSGEGPIRGTLVFGKLLDESVIQQLSQITHHPLTLISAVQVDAANTFHRLAKKFETSAHPVVEPLTKDVVGGWFPIRDVRGELVLLGRADAPRRIYQQGLAYFLVSLVLIGLGVGLSTRIVLDRLVLQPVARLRLGVRKIAASGDLTQRMTVRGHDEMADLARDVNSMVQALNAAQQALTAAKEEAEAATMSKSQFLANMSHEIRTPMTAILGYSELLLDPQHDQRERVGAVQCIRRNGEHLLHLINDILDISKIEAGRFTVENIACSPCRIVADASSLMRGLALAKGLQFAVRYEGKIPETIHSDPTRLRQILLNLLGNAVKFTERGSVQLNIKMEQRGPAEAFLVFEVIDTGIGLSKAQMDRLFQPFAQADDSHARRFGGTGLGLVISRRLAAMLHGELSLRSEEGKGSTFTVTIGCGSLDGVRLLDSPHEIEDASGFTLPVAITSGQSLAGVRVLVAEDGPDNQRLLKHHLTKASAEVTLASDGRQTIMEAKRSVDDGRPFDVILMDMQMPLTDGYAATRTLRAMNYDRPIIALTAHAMPGDREKCIAAGCDDYLTKPIDRALLLETVDRFSRHERFAARQAS